MAASGDRTLALTLEAKAYWKWWWIAEGSRFTLRRRAQASLESSPGPTAACNTDEALDAIGTTGAPRLSQTSGGFEAHIE